MVSKNAITCLILVLTVQIAIVSPSPAQEGKVGSKASEQGYVQTLDMQQVISEVVKKNDRIAAAKLMAKAAERKIGPAGAWKDPMIMVGVQNLPTNFDFEMDNMTMKMIGVSQEIPYSGFKGYERKSAEASAIASQEEANSMTVDLVSAAKTAYVSLYYRRLNVAELRRQRELLQQVAAASLSKLRTNEAGQEEVLAAQADLWRVDAMILSAEQEVTEAVSGLNSLRGANSADTSFELVEPDFPEIPETSGQWIASAESYYPPLRKLQRQSESYHYSSVAMNRMRWPMLNVSAGYGLRSGYATGADGMRAERDDMLNFGIVLSLPVFEGRLNSQGARSMEAMKMSSLAEASQLRREVAARITALHERARRLSASLALYRDRILPSSEDAFRTALNGYASDRTDFISLLTYATDVYRDRITINELSSAFSGTMIEVERLTTNTEALAIEVPVNDNH